MTAPRLLIVANVVEMFRDFLLPYAKHFRAKGWKVDAMGNGVTSSKECSAAFDRVLEIDWSRNPFDFSNFVHAPTQFCQVVDSAGYDLVHAHTPIAGFIARFALKCMRCHANRPKMIYTAHGFHFYPGGSKVTNCIFRNLEWTAGRWTDYLVVINRTDEEAARQYRFVPEDKLVYMPGIGLDLSHYSAAAVSSVDIDRFRNEIGLRTNDTVLLMVAEFTSVKRHRDAVRAFALLPTRSTHLVFAGEGPLMTEIKNLADSLSVSDRIHFLGYRRDISILISAAAATILPSAREGLPRSIMESLSLNTPVIATDIRGCRDLLSDGAGLLVPVGDCERLAQAMEWVLENPAEAAEMGSRGRQAVAVYDINQILHLHEELYSRALGLKETG
jgi:glycosyltransferase involved in cell wall biosynthesis